MGLERTGTDHVPGIQPSDVEELLEHGAKVVVLSKGIYQRLQTCSETLEMLKQKRDRLPHASDGAGDRSL